MRRLMIVPVVALVACTPPQVDPSAYGSRPSEAQVQEAIEVYKQNALKDGFSAQTRNVSIRPGSMYRGLVTGGGWAHGWLVTFEVNAKNSFGAYVGWRRREILMEGGSPSSVRWPMAVE